MSSQYALSLARRSARYGVPSRSRTSPKTSTLPGRDVGRQPVERGPVEREAQVGLRLGRKAADRRAVEGQVVVRLEQELLVVVEHVEAPFEVGEAGRHRLDPALVGEVAEPALGDQPRIGPGEPLGLRLEVHLFELVVRDLKEIAQGGGGNRLSLTVPISQVGRFVMNPPCFISKRAPITVIRAFHGCAVVDGVAPPHAGWEEASPRALRKKERRAGGPAPGRDGWACR